MRGDMSVRDHGLFHCQRSCPSSKVAQFRGRFLQACARQQPVRTMRGSPVSQAPEGAEFRPDGSAGHRIVDLLQRRMVVSVLFAVVPAVVAWSGGLCPANALVLRLPGRRLTLHDVLLGVLAWFQAHCYAG